MEKYYWICYERTSKLGIVKEEDVFKEHPFKAIKRLRKRQLDHFTMLNYKEITKEEYDMFNLRLEDM